VLVFLAQDAGSHVFCYSNADLRKGEEAEEIFQFIAFGSALTASFPAMLFLIQTDNPRGAGAVGCDEHSFHHPAAPLPKLLKEIVLVATFGLADR